MNRTTKAIAIAMLALPWTAAAQDSNNPINTVVPFLNISPESRGSGMGDAGVATLPDINSQHWNPAKYAFMTSKAGASFSVTPWLRQLVSDINLFYVAGYYRINKRSTASASLRYFSLGEITYTDEMGYKLSTGEPNEFAIDAAYSLMLSKSFSGAIALRYIRSDMGTGTTESGEDLVPGNAFAADVAFYFKKGITIDRNRADIMAGINISNIGSKISYDEGTTEEFLPANLRIGAGIMYEIDRYNKIGATVEFNKLLVPTPDRGEDGSMDYDERQDYRSTSVPASIFKSFGDAPGGAKEELREITIGGGLEYVYNDMFSLRGGYFHENEYKGNRKYATAGVGIKYQMLNVEASYLIATQSNSALANTIRITVGFDLGKIL